MREAIGASFDRVPRLLLGADVYDRELALFVGRVDHRLHRFLGQGRSLEAVLATIVVHDLDVVRAFLDAGVHPIFCFGRLGKRGDCEAILGSVPAERRSAMLWFFPSASSRFTGCTYLMSVNMSSSVVTPKAMASLRASPKV